MDNPKNKYWPVSIAGIIKKVLQPTEQEEVEEFSPEVKSFSAPVEINYWWIKKQDADESTARIPVKQSDAETIEPCAKFPLDINECRKAIFDKLVADEFEMFAIPSNILKIINILNDDTFKYSEVSELVSTSPVLTADFIRVANSAVYSRGSKMSDVRMILPRLGRTTVLAMLYMHAALLNLANRSLFKDIASRIVDQSFCVATLNHHICKQFPVDPNNAFQAGLLHQIGKLVILRELNDDYEFPKSFIRTMNLKSFESLFAGLYTEIGYLLGQSWKLSEEICYTISKHTTPPKLTPNKESYEKIVFANATHLNLILSRFFGKGLPLPPTNPFNIRSAVNLELSEKNPVHLDKMAAVPDVINPSA